MIEQLFSTRKVIVRLRAGPLGEYMDAFAAELSAQGYSPSTLRQKIRWVACLNQWLSDRQIDAVGLNEERVAEFSAWHSAERSSQDPDTVTFRQLLCSLRVSVAYSPSTAPSQRRLHFLQGPHVYRDSTGGSYESPFPSSPSRVLVRPRRRVA